MATIYDPNQYPQQDPLFEALVKYAAQQKEAPGATDPLFEALAQFHQEGQVSAQSSGETLEEKKRRALELLEREGLIGVQA